MISITKKDLEGMVDQINKTAGFIDPKYSEVGSYTLSGAYGGWKLEKYTNESGGATSITSGFGPKRELYYLMKAYLDGMTV